MQRRKDDTSARCRAASRKTDGIHYHASDYEAWAQAFKALAHPGRIFVMEQIRLRPRTVCELADLVDVDVSTMSRHIQALKQAGLLRTQREGVFIRCFCVSDCVPDMIRCLAQRAPGKSPQAGGCPFSRVPQDP
jgi:DNA-binding transcriptional ArsR family regulator